MAKLSVEIVADDVVRRFRAVGDPSVIVAAFRVWLAGPDAELSMAEGADDVDIEADGVLGDAASVDGGDADESLDALLERLKKRDAEFEQKAATTPKAEVVWNGSMERSGEAPGLSGAGSSLSKDALIGKG